jgi:hypothetical protein
MHAIMKKIINEPYNLELRMKFAEVMEKKDPARSMLIKQQVLIQALGRSEDRSDLQRTVRDLLKKHRKRWTGELTTMCSNVDFGNGMVESIWIEAEQWIRHGDELKKKAPVLDLILLNKNKMPNSFFQLASLQGLRSLRLAQTGATDNQVELLAKSPFVADLCWLDLSSNSLGLRSLRALAASSTLESLQWLNFGSNKVEDPSPEPCFDMGTLVHVNYSQLGMELEKEFGKKAWLSLANSELGPSPDELIPRRLQ